MAQKHHTVQEKYLAQWHNPLNKNQLQIRLHDTGEIRSAGANSKVFWKKDFNISLETEENRYAPEQFTQTIDGKAIRAIKNITRSIQWDLSNDDRNAIAAYVGLQYVRTPKYRKEMDEWMEAIIKPQFKDHITAPNGKLKIEKDTVLKSEPKDSQERELMEQVRRMSDQEFQEMVDKINLDELKFGLTTEGHSKLLYKSMSFARTVFDYQWTFFIAAKDTSFITSDNPCFIISNDPKRLFCGFNSDYACTVFPLSPTVCLYIDQRIKSYRSIRMPAPKSIVRALNKLVLQNSCDCVVAKDSGHLKNLTKNYKHRKFKEVKVTEIGDYVWVRSE